MKYTCKNRGFTLVELLIAITVLGIITAIAIVAMTNINKKDVETQEGIYEDTLITAGKLYIDSYSEDVFGRNKYGCKKIPYSKLKDKELIKELESNKLKCAYQEDEKDTSGLIVRKIDNKYYYESILWCENKSTGVKESVLGSINQKLYEIPDTYCNESATEDKNPPVVYYTNNNKRYFYNNTNKPIPKVWVYDDVSGLQVGKVKLDIEWKDLSNNRILNSRTNTYTISKPGRNLSPQTLALINEVKSGGNGQYQLTVRANTVVDGAGHMLKGNTPAVVEQPKVNPSRVTKLVTHPDIFYVENSVPTLTRTKNSQNWTNNAYKVTFIANDNDGKTVYSGIKKYTIKVVNTSTGRTIDNNITCGTTTPETGITKNNPKNSSQASRNCSILFGTGNYKDGSYTVETNVEDWAGNTNHSSNTYKYDGSAPTVTITRKSYNQYSWKAIDTGYSGLSGYKNDKNPANPTSGFTSISPVANTKTGTVTISSAGTYYTHVRDAAGNPGKNSIKAYLVKRSQGTGTTLTTRYEKSNGTTFSNNSVVLHGTPIYITAKLKAGYGNLVIKYGNTTINSGTSKNTTANVTISTSATKCAKGYWNDGTHSSCQRCPAGYRDGDGTTKKSNCIKSVSCGYHVASKNGSATICGKGTYKGKHNVKYGSTSKCDSCGEGKTSDAGSCSSSNCKPICKEPIVSHWTDTGGGFGCIVGGETVNLDGASHFNVTGCSEGLSGYMCYHNPGGADCAGLRSYSGGSYDDDNGLGHMAFKWGHWVYYRSSEYARAHICNSTHCINIDENLPY